MLMKVTGAIISLNNPQINLSESEHRNFRSDQNHVVHH